MESAGLLRGKTEHVHKLRPRRKFEPTERGTDELAWIAHGFGCFRRKSAVRKDFAQIAKKQTVFRRSAICGVPAKCA